MIILTPNRYDLSRDRVLTDDEIKRVAPAFVRVVEHSYLTHPMRNPTRAEYARRVDIVTTTYFELRKVNGWTETRALSHVRQALAAKLDTATFNPKRRAMFVRDALLFPDAAPRSAIAL